MRHPVHLIALLLVCVIALGLWGCEHDTGAEQIEATVVYSTDLVVDRTVLSATVWPREESWSLWGSEHTLDREAEVGLNLLPVEYDDSKYAYYSEIAPFTAGMAFDLHVVFDQHETYRYSAVVKSLAVDGIPTQPRLFVGDALRILWTPPVENARASLEIKPLDESIPSTKISSTKTISWTVPESLRYEQLRLVFTVREHLADSYGFQGMLLEYRYEWLGRVY